MINRQRAGTYFYRIVVSPDPKSEDANRTLSLENLARRPLAVFARRRRADLGDFAAVCHTDHSPNRHVHVIACFDRKLTRGDLYALRVLVTRQALGLSLDVSFESARVARSKAQVPYHGPDPTVVAPAAKSIHDTISRVICYQKGRNSLRKARFVKTSAP
jgi:hypothetical protein